MWDVVGVSCLLLSGLGSLLGQFLFHFLYFYQTRVFEVTELQEIQKHQQLFQYFHSALATDNTKRITLKLLVTAVRCVYIYNTYSRVVGNVDSLLP